MCLIVSFLKKLPSGVPKQEFRLQRQKIVGSSMYEFTCEKLPVLLADVGECSLCLDRKVPACEI